MAAHKMTPGQSQTLGCNFERQKKGDPPFFTQMAHDPPYF